MDIEGQSMEKPVQIKYIPRGKGFVYSIFVNGTWAITYDTYDEAEECAHWFLNHIVHLGKN